MPKRRDKNHLKKLVLEYVRKKPNATVVEIERNYKVNIYRLFGGIKEVYEEAGVKYPRPKRKKHIIRKQVIQLIRKNRLVTAKDMQERIGINVYRYFRDLSEAYKEANVKFLPNYLKRRIKKEKKVVKYIKSHPNATQWEINKICKCHVQEMFDDGIREAFKIAKVPYPERRRNVYGSATKTIRQRSTDFEKKISNILKEKGAQIQVRTKSGIADAVVQINKELVVVEIKSYESKPISLSDVKQIRRYLNDLSLTRGVIISSKGNEIKRIKSSGFEIGIVPEARMNELWGRCLTR